MTDEVRQQSELLRQLSLGGAAGFARRQMSLVESSQASTLSWAARSAASND